MQLSYQVSSLVRGRYSIWRWYDRWIVVAWWRRHWIIYGHSVLCLLRREEVLHYVLILLLLLSRRAVHDKVSVRLIGVQHRGVLSLLLLQVFLRSLLEHASDVLSLSVIREGTGRGIRVFSHNAVRRVGAMVSEDLGEANVCWRYLRRLVSLLVRVGFRVIWHGRLHKMVLLLLLGIIWVKRWFLSRIVFLSTWLVLKRLWSSGSMPHILHWCHSILIEWIWCIHTTISHVSLWVLFSLLYIWILPLYVFAWISSLVVRVDSGRLILAWLCVSFFKAYLIVWLVLLDIVSVSIPCNLSSRSATHHLAILFRYLF